jgi:hypothetical protein
MPFCGSKEVSDMTAHMTFWRAAVFLILVAFIVNIPKRVVLVAAQDGAAPSLRINHVDTSSFPDIRIYLTGRDANLQEDLDMRVLEDGVEQENVTSELQRGGTQTALVMDASSFITKAGKTGNPRNVEVGHAVRSLVELGILSPELDRLTAIVPVVGGGSQVLRSWTSRDFNAVSNSFYQFQPDPQIGSTSLYGLLSDALDLFREVDSAEPVAARAIVVFSDGVAGESEADSNVVVEKAKRMDVRIHSVLLGEDSAAARESMQRIAQLTGGHYVHLTTIEGLDDLWQTLVKDAELRVLTYRSHKPDPARLTVQARLAGTSLELSERIPPITPPLAPVDLQVQVVSPPGGEVIERLSANPQAALSELEPQEIVLNLQVAWPDGHPRQLTSLELNYADKSQSLAVTSLGETLQFTVSIADLAQGSYVLGLSAIDELGLTGDTSFPFRIVERRPALPTATPAPTSPPASAVSSEEDTSIVAGENGQRITAIAFGVLSLVLLLVLLLVVLMVLKGGLRQRALELLTSTLGAVTEPFLRGKLAQQSPSARLVLVSGGNSSLPAVVDLYSGNALIGREPSLVNVVLRDRRVSRYHCRINQAADGSFRIWDEGGVSGTYVNNERVGMSGQRLRPGDLINIGPVQYRFELVAGEEAWAGSDSPDATVPYTPKQEPPSSDSTEVYVPGSARPPQPQADASSEESTEVYVPDGTEPYQPDQGPSMDDTDICAPDGTETIDPEARQVGESDDWAEIEEDTPH